MSGSEKTVKTEKADSWDKILEVNRLRKVVRRASARLEKLSASNAASQMAEMASSGKFLMVEIDTDDEETECVVDGDPKTIDLTPRTVEQIKKEVQERSWNEIITEPAVISVGEETNDSISEDSRLQTTFENSLEKASPKTRKRIVGLKRKVCSMSRRNISPRFVNDSLNSTDNMSSDDMNDK